MRRRIVKCVGASVLCLLSILFRKKLLLHETTKLGTPNY